jgi:hypothetical protein
LYLIIESYTLINIFFRQIESNGNFKSGHGEQLAALDLLGEERFTEILLKRNHDRREFLTREKKIFYKDLRIIISV